MPARVGSESGSNRFGAYVGLLCDNIQVEQNEKSIAASLEISDDEQDMEEEEDDNGRLGLPPHRHTHNAQASPWSAQRTGR